MVPIRQLYELQELDLEIDATRSRLTKVEGQLGEDPALVEAKAALPQERAALTELEKKQRAAEVELDDIRTEIAAQEKKLYDSSVRNPKELLSMQDDVNQHRGRQRAQEDRVLEVMEQVEKAKAELEAKSSEVAATERQWQEGQAQLSREQAALKDTQAGLEGKRATLASRIDPATLNLYEELRTAKQGRAVARVEQGRCLGCRINLPLPPIQRARAGQSLVHCTNCGRIIYVG